MNYLENVFVDPGEKYVSSSAAILSPAATQLRPENATSTHQSKFSLNILHVCDAYP